MITIRKTFTIIGLCDDPAEIHVAESDLRSLRSAIDEVLDPPKSEDVQLPLLTIQKAAEHVQGLPSIEHPAGAQIVALPGGFTAPGPGVPVIGVPPIVTESEFTESVAGVPAHKARTVLERFSRQIEKGSTQNHAVSRLGNMGLSAARIREVLRAQGIDIPEPAAPGRGKEPPATKKAAEIRKTPKVDPQENAHLVRDPRRSHVPIPRPADRVPPPPPKPSTAPPRPAVAILGADHIETVQGIRMILQGRDAAEISREFRTDRITKTAIAVWMESNGDWLDWLRGQPPFKVNEILVALQQDLKPIENRGNARPTVHKEAQL